MKTFFFPLKLGRHEDFLVSLESRKESWYKRGKQQNMLRQWKNYELERKSKEYLYTEENKSRKKNPTKMQ